MYNFANKLTGRLTNYDDDGKGLVVFMEVRGKYFKQATFGNTKYVAVDERGILVTNVHRDLTGNIKDFNLTLVKLSKTRASSDLNH